jgi:prepilin-type processing-associated H-X9-DG protein
VAYRHGRGANVLYYDGHAANTRASALWDGGSAEAKEKYWVLPKYWK